MNLFWKNIFRGITPTTTLEKQETELVNAMHRYAEVEKSFELAEYKKLLHEVKSAAFQENKKVLKNRKYKDTEEYEITKRFNKLHNSHAIVLYYEVLQSEELREYRSFESSLDYELLGDKKKVKNSELLQKYKKFEQSKEFKTYTRFHDSFVIKEYEDLKQKVSSPEFKKSNEFWANPNRWQTTPEFELEERYLELAKNPDIVFFENEKPERFEKYRSLNPTFQDEFDWNTLDNSHWNFGFHYKNANLIGNHSFANEKQANNSGKNVSVVDGILKIATKHEKTTARAWHPEKGFIEKEFDFTSDVLQTATKFRQQKGVFRAKLRCHGNIHHAFWLGAGSKLPHISIFHFNGKQITVGNSNKNIVDGVKITGLNPTQFYIYTLIWTEKELVWLINDLEVYRTASNIPKEEMYLAFSSFISAKQHGTAGSLEVDWVRVYAN
ncbi:MAG TPA: family 16 glycosylhydrolase [Paludibacter sp.]|nr:family 16 glycosylhydrolase [Paludibacter sp.]